MRCASAGRSASCTLAYAYDDWAAAELAAEMQQPAELVQMYRTRALNYQNVWDSQAQVRGLPPQHDL
eukprot:COSAG01_NODE_48940_length_376_cov_1.823105_2_plen_66_part_01